MRRKGRFDRHDYKIASSGRGKVKGLGKIIIAALVLGGAWLLVDHLLSLPQERPKITRYEILSIP